MIALAALLAACSVHPDHSLVAAIARAHSDGSPLVVRNVDWSNLDAQDEPLQVRSPASRTRAHRVLVDVLEAGGTAVAGLMPVRLAWLRRRNLPASRIFSPCDNVRVATAKLLALDRGCSSHGRPTSSARRSCVLRRYGKATGLGALHIVARIQLRSPDFADWLRKTQLDGGHSSPRVARLEIR